MKCGASEEAKHQKSVEFFVPEKSFLPLNYFTKEWARKLIEENPIKEPFGGLHNLGNSCFLNSVLQCLAYTPGLNTFASMLPNFVFENCQEKPCFLYHFSQVCKALRVLKVSAPHIFFGNLKKISPDMECGQQQDAHEYLFALINHFDDEFCVTKSKGTPNFSTPMHSFFGGQYKETRRCSECGAVSTTTTKFLDVTLPIDADTIESCLDSIMSPKDCGSNYICENCKKAGTCTNETVFEEAPNILIITMVRFSSIGYKVDKPVEFGLYLDLSPYVEGEDDVVYELYAIINHSGHVINRGHFSCFVKCGDGYWYNCDDVKVNKDSSQNVLDSRPYVLFYKRRYDDDAKPVNVTIGIPRVERRKRSPVIIDSPVSTKKKVQKPAKKEESPPEPPSLPSSPNEGFFSEVSDYEEPVTEDGQMDVEKTFITKKGNLTTMHFVCSSKK